MDKTKKTLLSNWFHPVADEDPSQDVFWENEIKANRFTERVMLFAAFLLFVMWVFNMLGILAVSGQYVYMIFPVGIAAFVIPAMISGFFKGAKKWIKYMLIVAAVVTLAYIDCILLFNATLLIVLPVIFSCRYYSRLFTIQTAIATSIFFGVSAYVGALYNIDNPDLNFYAVDKAEYLRQVMLLSFLPKLMIFLLITIICFEIARYGRKMVYKQDIISKKTARVETELEMAWNIQNEALPSVDNLPENPYRKLDLAACMIPAKEVGGDFYDFFYPDAEHLALIVADVADKGVAASLYMMMAKTFLESNLSISLSPGEVLDKVNCQLCERSFKGMFVTVWLGILDLKTGDMVTASAGHEYPAIQRKNGQFELFKDKHGFVLGAHKGMKFPETSLHLDEGDTMFMYTDGVPEANDTDGQMFGVDRMIETLNRHKECAMNDLIVNVKSDIDEFASDTLQFDDTTMLAIRLQEATN